MNVAPLGPVAGAYYLDNSRVCCIVGPVGSGKSTASCLRLQRHAYEQTPGPDGVAHSRFAIVRNTRPQLRDTTLKTWLQIFPESLYGPFHYSDMVHVWNFKPAGYTHPIHAEFIFRPLDDAADVDNLLSLEVSGFYFNELREIDETLIAHAGRRAGRFPAVANGGCTWSGWIADTNPWDTEHYLHDRFVDHPREGWRLLRQPGGHAPDAENIANLPAGYYDDARKDFSAEDARVYIDADWGRTRTGKPIYTEYADRLHCRAFELDPRVPIRIGMDFGRTPAAVIAQKSVFGQWRVRWELCAQDMGIKAFGAELKRFVADRCPWAMVEQFTGDPAGVERDGSENTAFDLLKAAGWAMASPASSNEPSIRVGTVNDMLARLVSGEPALLLHPDCRILRRACIDGYHYRKIQVAGNRFDDKPNKNEFSHVAEALQYLLLGGGEGKALVRRPLPNRPRQRYAIT